MESLHRGVLSIELADGSDHQLGSAEHPLTIGKDADNQIALKGELVSRQHASITCEKGDYFLVDHSTNGCFVQMEDKAVRFVHRSRLRLWGAGWISCAQQLTAPQTYS